MIEGNQQADFVFHPVTPDRWSDLEKLFGPSGAGSGCWCMWWRLPHTEFHALGAPGRKEALRQLVESGAEPGILAYAGSEPVGWCCVGPRERFLALERSRFWYPVDDQPVWSIVCFFIAKGHRRRGLTSKLLAAAIEYARSHGAEVVEGYPLEPDKPKVNDTAGYRGMASVFLSAGFQEVARRAEKHPVMRLCIGQPASEGASGKVCGFSSA